MIQFHQVTKQYPGNEFSLGEVDFNIDEGEFVFLIGPSGSGKTTLIRMLIREEKPSEGKIFFDDRDITNLSRRNVYKLRRQIGVIFQDYKLLPDKNAYENVAFAMEAAGRSNRDIQETVPYVLDIVGLSHRADAFPEQLSGGEKQRIAIARAVSNNPRLLIADEPTGNLDPASAWDIVQILSKINNWGTTVIMSTHGTDIVNTLNKRVIQMESGKVVRDDNKGMYEITAKFEDRMLSEGGEEQVDEEDTAELRKGPIKVNIAKEEEEPKSKKGFNLDWLKVWKHEAQIPVTDMPSLAGDSEQMEEL
ncbi:cell division ATP-binding protein FtsE, partial [Candidatus Dojkabacteria bacterium]|nr:cell division ATP-binding protein FtsE [Candidatus Dojkabacteria bacterium]